MTTREDILNGANELRKKYPSYRVGQAIFNYVDKNLKVARHVQFIDKVDCFYDSSMIDKFIECVLQRVNK